MYDDEADSEPWADESWDDDQWDDDDYDAFIASEFPDHASDASHESSRSLSGSHRAIGWGLILAIAVPVLAIPLLILLFG